MDVIKAVQEYITKMVTSIQGMKVLLLDKETMGIVSMVYSQSEILQKEVYLFERLDQPDRDTMVHVNAVVFVRPTDENIQLLQKELHEPNYGEYHIFFSNIVKTNLLEELAQSDEHETVQEVQEFFADYFAVTPHTVSLNAPKLFFSTRQTGWMAHKRRALEGITGVLLSLRRRPAIRYAYGSELAEQLAADVARHIDENRTLFDFRQAGAPPLLLILDRKDDPVTPLLLQWTYQAMVHELIGIDNNRVNLSHAPGIRKDLKQLVLSGAQDSFYRDNMFVNFGDLGANIKTLVDSYQAKTKSNEKIQSIEDIKNFIDEFPEFRKLAGNVSKHVALVGELSRVIDTRQLMTISELEQELANKSDHGTAKTNVLDFISKDTIELEDKLRLAALYALRYETSSGNVIDKVIEGLMRAGADRDQVRIVANMTEYAGNARRAGDLYGTKTLLSMAKKSFRRGLSGATNVYTEHVPAIAEVLDSIAKGRINDKSHPLVFGSAASREKLQEVIIYMIGGITYEEVLAVHQFQAANTQLRVVLGGCHVLNSESFIAAVAAARNA